MEIHPDENRARSFRRKTAPACPPHPPHRLRRKRQCGVVWTALSAPCVDRLGEPLGYLFSTNKLPGIDASSSRWEVLAAFLKAGDARAERLIESDGGLIFLQSVPHRPNTGAIYVYNE